MVLCLLSRGSRGHWTKLNHEETVRGPEIAILYLGVDTSSIFFGLFFGHRSSSRAGGEAGHSNFETRENSAFYLSTQLHFLEEQEVNAANDFPPTNRRGWRCANCQQCDGVVLLFGEEEELSRAA